MGAEITAKFTESFNVKNVQIGNTIVLDCEGDTDCEGNPKMCNGEWTNPDGITESGTDITDNTAAPSALKKQL